MAPRKLVFPKNGEQENNEQTLHKADEEHSNQKGSPDSDSEEEGGPTPVAPKKPKFGASLEPAGPEPAENGSACSSPTASGFIIMPAVKPSGKKKKKIPASKVFPDEDEIALLKGLAVFWADGRNNKWAEFHKFIKDDLTNQFTKIQVSEKIRALNKKFEANFERARANAGRLGFSDSHESVVFELSKALWGDDKGVALENRESGENEELKKKLGKRKQLDEHNEVNKKMNKRKQDEENKTLEQEKEVDEHDEEHDIAESRKQGGEGNEEREKGKEVKEIDKGDFASAFPLLYASFGMFGYPKIVKEKCVLIPREKAQELEEMWKELNADAIRLDLKKMELIKRDLQDSLERK